MTKTTAGWVVFIAALGLMMTLMSSEVAALPNWGAAAAPPFVAKVMTHFGVVVAAFVGGKLIPS